MAQRTQPYEPITQVVELCILGNLARFHALEVLNNRIPLRLEDRHLRARVGHGRANVQSDRTRSESVNQTHHTDVGSEPSHYGILRSSTAPLTAHEPPPR